MMGLRIIATITESVYVKKDDCILVHKKSYTDVHLDGSVDYIQMFTITRTLDGKLKDVSDLKNIENVEELKGVTRHLDLVTRLLLWVNTDII
jgi:hypothetical protein